MTHPTPTRQHRCSGCGRCVAACRNRLYSLETVGWRKQIVRRRPESCTNCLGCFRACPMNAIPTFL
ncbi:MAG TPA: 4Fe-4S dicluster domain-containing protein [Geobacteraceae bacterium]